MSKPFRLTMERQAPEAQIQRDILRYLGATLPHGFILHHSPNGGMLKGEVGRSRGLGTKPGWPDLQVVGRLESGEPFTGYIEVKAPKGRLSEEQIAMRDRLIDCGYPVGVARSIDDVRDLVRAWGLPSRDASVRRSEAA